MANMIWKDIATWLHADIIAAGLDKRLCKAWDEYYISTLKRPGMIDNVQQLPMVPPGLLRNPMTGVNRLGNPACKFPIAYAFGD